MSQKSDDLITQVAKNEHQDLKESVIQAAKNWQHANRGELAANALSDAVVVLVSFESRHKNRLRLP